jgi:hypothetical protein
MPAVSAAMRKIFAQIPAGGREHAPDFFVLKLGVGNMCARSRLDSLRI